MRERVRRRRGASPKAVEGAPSERTSGANPLLTLQRSAGNRATSALLRKGGGNDPLGGAEVPGDIEARIGSSSGQPLDAGTRTSMEGAFGADFSGVRVHTGGDAGTLSESLQAKAFTTGQDVFFGKGAYDPGSSSGQELLAHELTHVVQQGGGVDRRINRFVDKQTFKDRTKQGRAGKSSAQKSIEKLLVKYAALSGPPIPAEQIAKAKSLLGQMKATAETWISEHEGDKKRKKRGAGMAWFVMAAAGELEAIADQEARAKGQTPSDDGPTGGGNPEGYDVYTSVPATKEIAEKGASSGYGEYAITDFADTGADVDDLFDDDSSESDSLSSSSESTTISSSSSSSSKSTGPKKKAPTDYGVNKVLDLDDDDDLSMSSSEHDDDDDSSSESTTVSDDESSMSLPDWGDEVDNDNDDDSSSESTTVSDDSSSESLSSSHDLDDDDEFDNAREDDEEIAPYKATVVSSSTAKTSKESSKGATAKGSKHSKAKKAPAKYVDLRQVGDHYKGEFNKGSVVLADIYQELTGKYSLTRDKCREVMLAQFGWTNDDFEKYWDKAPLIRDKYADPAEKAKVAKVDEEDRANYQVHDLGGSATYGPNKEQFQTKDMFAKLKGAGWGIFVMSPSGEFFAGSHKVGLFHHSSFLGGGDVGGAGELKVENGSLKGMTNKSGHYIPKAPQMIQVFEEIGPGKLSGVKYTHMYGPNGALQKEWDAKTFYEQFRNNPGRADDPNQ